MNDPYDTPIINAKTVAAIILTAVNAFFVSRLGLGDLFILISNKVGTNLATLWFAASAVSLLITFLAALMFVLRGIGRTIDHITGDAGARS